MSTRQAPRNVGPTIALDLGENAVRVVEMELGSDPAATRILRRGTAPLPPNAWTDLTANRDAFVGAIRSALSSAGINGRSVVACIPRRLVTVRFARLPSAPPDQMRGMVQFEAQQYILFSLDEVVLDYHTVSEPLAGFGVSDGDDMETVLLVAARRSLVTDIQAIFKKAGLDLRKLSVSSLALAEHARDVLEPTALIDIQPGSMDVAVVADGRLLFTRATTLDLEGISPDVAQRRLEEEVARSFTSYQNEFRNKILGHVYISGASVTTRDSERLERSLSGILEMPVSRLHNRLLPGTDPDAVAYAVASGMGLQLRPDALVPISLVTDEVAARKALFAKRLRQQLTVAVAGAALVSIVLYARAMVTDNAQKDQAMIKANSALKQAKTALAAVQKSHDKLQSFTEELDKGLDRKHLTVDVVVALHAALPPSKDIWLTQMEYQRGGQMTLRGESKTATAPTDLVIALQSSGAFYDVKLSYMGDAQETAPVAAVAAPPPADDVASSDVPTGPLPGLNAVPGMGQGGPGGTPNMPMNFPGVNGMPQGFQPGGFQPGGFQPGNGFPGRGNGFPPGAQPGGSGGTGSPGGAPIIFTPDSGTTIELSPPAPQPVSPPNQSRGDRNSPEQDTKARFHRQAGSAQADQERLTQEKLAQDEQARATQVLLQQAQTGQAYQPDPSNQTDTNQFGRRRRQRYNGMGGQYQGGFPGMTPNNPGQPFVNPGGPMQFPTRQGPMGNSPVTLNGRASSNRIGNAKAPAAPAKKPISTKVMRTSFIITCRVNPNCTDLLAGIPQPGQKASGKSTSAPAPSVPKPAVPDDNGYSGDNNAD